MSSISGPRIFLAVVAAIATVAYLICYNASKATRALVRLAGDVGLPGVPLLPHFDDVAEFIRRLRGNPALHTLFLDAQRYDLGLIVLCVLTSLAIAWLCWREPRARPSGVLLIVAAVAAAGADLTENLLLRSVVLAKEPGTIALISLPWVTTTKWLLWSATGVLSLVVVLRTIASPRAWGNALFLDVAYLIDSVWRRTEFRMHRAYVDEPTGALRRWDRPRSYRTSTHCWWLAVSALAVGFGPAWIDNCLRFPFDVPIWLPYAAGALAGLPPIGVMIWRRSLIRGWIDRRFKQVEALDPYLDKAVIAGRSRIVRLVVGSSVLLPALALFGIVYPLIKMGAFAPAYCAKRTGVLLGGAISSASLGLLAVCVVVIFMFGMIYRSARPTATLIWLQSLLLVVLAAMQWWVWAPGANAASGTPYRHVFVPIVVAMAVVMSIAPLLARWIFRPHPRLPKWRRFGPLGKSFRDRFRSGLHQSEFFVRRDELVRVSTSLFANALVRIVYRPLALALLPAIFAFGAHADWVFALAGTGAVIAALLLLWSGLNERWQRMIADIERWFFRGIALPVSIFVIVIGGLRIAGVDYVTTLLDATPLGVLFGAVAVSYCLSWLVEYWTNRVAAVELLRILGAGVGNEIKIAADLRGAPAPEIAVAPGGRHLMVHGLGNFAVVGTSQRRLERVFNVHRLIEVMRIAGGPHGGNAVREIERRIGFYFFILNMLIVMACGGLAWYVYGNIVDSTGAIPLVKARAADPAARQPPDLARRVLARVEAGRAPIVIVGSGGGTRAALYTAHVLTGLNGLGVADDIVLASGVSGGGVALAYFVANSRLLVGAPGDSQDWQQFRMRVAEPFIRDVLEGVFEMRVAGRTPLSILLAESFERRLFIDRQRIKFDDLAGGPALILNSTMVSHPAGDSDVLSVVLEAPGVRASAACVEFERAFKLMSGGRLIFTNLQDVRRFPQGPSRIPDTRLPYRIVQDPSVGLAEAAAATANFPPVFPNARVVLDGGGDCRTVKSYFVTDGGAEENLGLISALYAIETALAGFRECRAALPGVPRELQGCERALPPIHVVIAEASAAGSDYAQDRGLSAGLGDAKDRLAGGLAEELIKRIELEYAELFESPSAMLRFHYLPLPLAFRARGGFGTHWMHAERIEVADPRLREAPGAAGIRLDAIDPLTRDSPRTPRIMGGYADATAVIKKSELEELWLALHHPDIPFCDAHTTHTAQTAQTAQTAHIRPDAQKKWTRDVEAVHRWICGDRGAQERPPRARDLHMESWKRLKAQLQRSK